MILLLTTFALATAPDHWRGVPFGLGTVQANVPPRAEGCVKGTGPAVAWLCTEQIGEAKIEVAYLVDRGVFFGIVGYCTGPLACRAVSDALVAAWGAPDVETTNNPANGNSLVPYRVWNGATLASTTYRGATETGAVVVGSNAARAKLDEIRAQDAAEAAKAGGL